MSVPAASSVLELLHIRKAFGGVVALHDATLQLYPGTVHALLGENGAGKSTLIKSSSKSQGGNWGTSIPAKRSRHSTMLSFPCPCTTPR